MPHKINSQNLVFIDGQISEIELVDAESDKPILRFKINSYHSAKPIWDPVTKTWKTKYYPTEIPVALYGKAALKLAHKFSNGDNVMVEGKLRMSQASKRLKLICVHMDFSTPVYRDIKPEDIIQEGEPDDGI